MVATHNITIFCVYRNVTLSHYDIICSSMDASFRPQFECIRSRSIHNLLCFLLHAKKIASTSVNNNNNTNRSSLTNRIDWTSSASPHSMDDKAGRFYRRLPFDNSTIYLRHNVISPVVSDSIIFYSVCFLRVRFLFCVRPTDSQRATASPPSLCRPVAPPTVDRQHDDRPSTTHCGRLRRRRRRRRRRHLYGFQWDKWIPIQTTNRQFTEEEKYN